MVRISELSLAKDAATLRLEGRIVGSAGAEVRNACERYLISQPRLTLDLADLSFVDQPGMALLLELVGREVKLINCSPFLREQLKEAGALCC